MISCVGPVISTQFMNIRVFQISGVLFNKTDVPMGMLVTPPSENQVFFMLLSC